MNAPNPVDPATEALADLSVGVPAMTAPGDTAPALANGPRIGVFDSGLGGLSVLKALRRHLPTARLLYVADSGHAPYGERGEAFVGERSLAISHFLLDQGAGALVVACNTATAAAVHTLRQRWPDLPIVGVEPGVKPAVALSTNQRIGVLATPGTLASDKFKRLIATHAQGAELVLQPCPGLAKEIENGELDTPALRALVAVFTEPLLAAGVDTVVLGCTHYPFILPLFRQALGESVRIIDTAEAVARHTARLGGFLSSGGEASASVRLWSSGEPAHLSQVAQRWLGLKTTAASLP